MHKKHKLALIAVCVVLLIVGGIGFSVMTKTQIPSPASQESTVPTEMLSVADVDRIQSALSSGDKSKQSEVMEPELAQAYKNSNGLFVGEIKIDSVTFISKGNSGVVQAEMLQPNGQKIVFMLVLWRKTGTSVWLVAGTAKKK